MKVSKVGDDAPSRVRTYAQSVRGRAVLEALLELCRMRALAAGVTHVTAHGDLNRLWTPVRRPQLDAVLESAERREVDRLVCSHLGALGGEPEQVHWVMARLAAAGVVVETLRDGPLGERAAYLLAYGDLREPTVRARRRSKD